MGRERAKKRFNSSSVSGLRQKKGKSLRCGGEAAGAGKRRSRRCFFKSVMRRRCFKA